MVSITESQYYYTEDFTGLFSFPISIIIIIAYNFIVLKGKGRGSKERTTSQQRLEQLFFNPKG